MRRLGFVYVLLLGAAGCGQSGGDSIDGIEGFVCGADGQTYSVKEAADGEHDVVHRGRCGAPMGCDSPADCFAGDECSPHGDADVCVPIPNNCQCAGVFEPVCGADGRTYINACEARCVEVAVVFEGMCEDDPCAAIDCAPGFMCEDGECVPEEECLDDHNCEPDEICIDWPQEEPAYCVWVGCDNDEQCRSDEHCVIDNVCQAPPAVGPCDAAFPRWFHNVETGSCEGFTWGGCGGNDNNFETKDECEAACPDLSEPKLSIAARAGQCEPDLNCPDIYMPVCGVDDATYGNGCEAELAGVDIAYDGECVAEITCLDRDCPDGWTCDFCEASNGEARYICLSPLAGACLPPDNCPDEGCPDGSYCGLCWVSFECIPDGAVC
ncbi:MAG: hypothetical protein JRG93_13295 [Deltaproteobacteria bacterium]|nr:hypothetical protein [Deltaproteobacteria bacterium]MBW2222838.1 hypothetical protein [Deltaproteobacteria bacterium]MBW2402418.1 hypothetical protein [Deltaproteobacteria bacterium]MBW2717586.1 hypothetical protein [Deltaproteobacteria bacterium]